MKSRLRAGVLLFGLPLVVGIGVSYGAKVLDSILSVFILGLYVVGFSRPRSEEPRISTWGQEAYFLVRRACVAPRGLATVAAG